MQSVSGPPVTFSVGTFDDALRDPATITASSPVLLLVGDSRRAPVPGVFRNCQADAPGRTIRCDLRVLDDIIDEMHMQGERDVLREQLLRLILAHELGHVVLGHSGSFYHGGADGFSIAKYVGYKTELEADEFAVRRIDALTGLDLTLEYGMIVQLAYQAMKMSLCPGTFPETCPCPGYKNASSCAAIAAGPGLPLTTYERFDVTLAGTHPEFIVRFARLLSLSRSSDNGWYQRQAQQILRQVRVKNEHGAAESGDLLFR